jgi:DNA polymerase elongation subunit (family B)
MKLELNSINMTKFYTNFHIDRSKGPGGYKHIHVRGYENGERFYEKIDANIWRPYAFLPSHEETGYQTLSGVNVAPFYFEDISDSYQKRKKWNERNQPWYGSFNWDYVYINEHYPGIVDYDVDLIKVGYIDIETMSEDGFPNVATADQDIICISLRCNGKTYVFAHQDYIPGRSDVIFIRCKNEVDMLYKFIDYWVSLDMDVITGWNVEQFDIPYIVNRIKRLMSDTAAERLSPYNQLTKRELSNSNYNDTYQINGITTLDYLQLYRKFSYKMVESYRLDNIANIELGQKKLDYSEFDSLHLLYKHDFQKFVDYNIVDVDLVEQLDDKLKMIEQALAIAYDAKSNYVDSFTTVRMWDTIIHNYLIDKKIVVPGKNDSTKERQIDGAYVKEPQVGIHKWVVSFDLNSLYPHLIMQYNISPETFRGQVRDFPDVHRVAQGDIELVERLELKEKNMNITGKGTLFSKEERGFLPLLMESMYNDRVKFKNKMIEAKRAYEKSPSREIEKRIAQNNNMQMAKKIQLNSAYGALSNEHFRFFANDLAESITLSGQLSIKWAERKINEYLNKILKSEDKDYVIAVDTDSLYITLDGLVEQVFGSNPDTKKVIDFLDKVCEEKLTPFLDNGYQELADYTNAYDQKMVMARECIADKGIWVAKKRYILHVHDLEGVRYNEPNLKMMGIEAVRSSTPTSCRENIKNALNIIMTKDNKALNDFVRQFRIKFRELPFEDIAFPRTVNKLSQYVDNTTLYRKGTPIHVKGAIVYNNYLVEQKKDKTYMAVKDGDKGKFCHLKLPNPVRVPVMTTPGTLPREFGLEKYIDFDTQYEKAFIEPLIGIVEKIGWTIQLEDAQLTFEDILNGS